MSSNCNICSINLIYIFEVVDIYLKMIIFNILDRYVIVTRSLLRLQETLLNKKVRFRHFMAYNVIKIYVLLVKIKYFSKIN